MPEVNRRLSFADLTFREIWHLVKYYFIAAFACFLIFGLPYVLFIGSGPILGNTLGIDPDKWTWWMDVLSLGVIALLIIMKLPDFLERFGGFLTEMGQAARRASVLKRTTALLLFVSWMFLWRTFPTPTFFLSVLVVLPIGFIIDEYNKMLKKKATEGQEE